MHEYDASRVVNATIIRAYEAECRTCPTKWQTNAVTILYTESIRAMREAMADLKARSAGWDAGNLWGDMASVDDPTKANRLMNRLQDKLVYLQSRVHAFHKDQGGELKVKVVESPRSGGNTEQQLVCTSRRDELISQLLQSERQYNHTLADFIRFFIEPFSQIAEGANVKFLMKRKQSTGTAVRARRKSSLLKGFATLKGASSMQKSVTEFLNGSVMLMYTQTLRQIQIVNQKLLAGLEKSVRAQNDWLVGSPIVEFTALMNVYLQYHRSFSVVCSAVLGDGKQRGVKQLIDALDAQSESELGFSQLMSKPVERSAQYRGIFEELNRATESNHPDKPLLEEALSNLQAFAKKRMNDAFEKTTTAKLHALYESISGLPKHFELSHHREFFKSGELVKRCRRTDKLYAFFLFSDVLVYATKMKAPSAKAKFSFHRMLSLKSLTLKDLPHGVSSRSDGLGDAKKAFEISTSEKSFVVLIPRSDVGAFVTKESWIKAISDAAQSAQEGAGCEAGWKAPVWQSDEACSHCTLCPQKFTFTCRKHHCRECGVLVCGNCSMTRKLLPSQHATKLLRVCDNCAGRQ